jgi:hypothetical protein
MADTKITEMVAGSLSADDLLTFVDDPTGTPVNKKIAYSTLESGLSITESQISDLGTYATTAYVDSAVAGLYDHKGGYNASTNSPDLDTSPSGILKGDAYTVSVAGTFFTAAVDAGDVLIADQDSPTLESHWTIVNRNIDEAAFATASHTHTASDVTDFSEAVDDRAAALVVGGTDITVTYDDGAGTLTIDSAVTGGDTLPVVDTTVIAKGSVDATKIVRLEVDGLTTGTTRVLTVQDADGTIELTGHSHSASNITSGTLTHERGGLEADVSAYAGVALIDSGTTSELKYNLTATTDPGVGDDSVDGYTVGSRWVNVTLDKEFVCLDASTGAAVWTETTAAAGGSGSLSCWTESCDTYSSQAYTAWQPSGSSPQNAIIGPLGAGYIAAQIPDGTSTGGNQRGSNAVDLQTSRAIATQVASGSSSVISGGLRNTASGDNSAIPGGRENVTSGDYSVALGYHASDRGLFGSVVHSSGGLGGSGKTQSRTMQLRTQTSDATAKTLTSDNATASTGNMPVLPDDSAYRFTAEILGRKTDGSALAAYTITGLISRGTGAASTTLDASSVTTEHEDVAAWSVAAVADTTNGGLAIQVTGAAATTISWIADVRTQEIA